MKKFLHFIAFKNNIVLIDASASFQYEAKKIINNNLYLDDKYSIILADNDRVEIFDNIEIKNIYREFNRFGGFDGVDLALDFINKHKIKGNLLFITDGYTTIDFSKINNLIQNLTILTIDVSPKIKNISSKINTYFFIKKYDLEDINIYYPPRDITPERCKVNKAINKYNL